MRALDHAPVRAYHSAETAENARLHAGLILMEILYCGRRKKFKKPELVSGKAVYRVAVECKVSQVTGHWRIQDPDWLSRLGEALTFAAPDLVVDLGQRLLEMHHRFSMTPRVVDGERISVSPAIEVVTGIAEFRFLVRADCHQRIEAFMNEVSELAAKRK